MLEKEYQGDSWLPTFVRLAWHEAGCFCPKSPTCPKQGGPHGLMAYEGATSDDANKGLAQARDLLMIIMNQMKVDGSIPARQLTKADFWQFCGVVAIELMGGPHINFRPGREDWPESEVAPHDRLPDAVRGYPGFEGTLQHLRKVFGRMGFNDTEIVP